MKNKIFIGITSIVICLIIGGIFMIWNDIMINPFFALRKENITVTNGKLTMAYMNENKPSKAKVNTIETKMVLKNNSNKELSYSLVLDKSDSYDYSYIISVSNDDVKYIEVYKENKLRKYLGYNLIVEPNKIIYVKIEISSNNKKVFDGKIKIDKNISYKDLFISNNEKAKSIIDSMIDNNKGFSIPGHYISSLNDLGITDISGYILIDSSDLTNIKYNYFTYNDKLMFFNSSSLSKLNIHENKGELNNIDFNGLCKLYTNNTSCIDLKNVSINELGTKKDFYNNVINIYNKVKDKNKKNDKVVIYNVASDINNKTNVMGYILVDNTKEEPNYYLYLTNKLYMVTGYNITKNGEINIDGKTIRQYVESAFNISGLDYSTVCKFSGFSGCFDTSENIY